MICDQCGCKVPDGVFRCRVCGSTELVASRSAVPMDASFGRGADLGPARGASASSRCSACGRPLAPGMRFCNGCGTKVMAAPTSGGTRCRACGRALAVGAKFCNGCGARVTEPVETAPAVAPAPAPAPVAAAPVEPRFSAAFKPAYMADELGGPNELPSADIPVEPVVPVIPEPVPDVEIPAVAMEAVPDISVFSPPLEEAQPEKTCAVCGRSVRSDAGFCPYCGATWASSPEPVAVEIPVVEIPVAEEPIVESKLCPVCGKALSPDAKFCNGCGASLEKKSAPVAADTRICLTCGKELPAEAKFCNGCGTGIAAAPAPGPAAAQNCPVCGKSLPGDMKFCNSCGADLRKKSEAVPAIDETILLTKKCHICGNEISMGVRYCNRCGADMECMIDEGDVGETDVLTPDPKPVAPVVMVTDPHVKGAEKGKKEKKPKKAKPAGKKSKKGLIIGIVLALVLILAAATVTVLLVDPFDWFESAEEKAALDEAAATAAMECMDKFYSGDMDGVLAACHDDVLSSCCKDNDIDREELVELLTEERSECIPYNLSVNGSFEVKTTDKLTSSDLEELQQTYSDAYDLELQDARKVKIESQVTYTYDGESKGSTSSATLLMCLIDGQWYVDAEESSMID